MASYDKYCNLFFNPCLDSDIYNSDFELDDNLLSKSIMNTVSSYLSIVDSNQEAFFRTTSQFWLLTVRGFHIILKSLV